MVELSAAVSAVKGSSMKRSLGPRYWTPCSSKTPRSTPEVKALTPLVEGPAFGQPAKALVEPLVPQTVKCGKVKPYSRGKLGQAVAAIRNNPEACADGLRSKVWAGTSEGPVNSREKTWAILANEAGFADPFLVTPDLIFTVMGALEAGGYRSTELYLDAARQQHINRGYDWTQQLALSAKRATRACKRGRGPSKQAQPLPLEKVPSVPQQAKAVHPGGPLYPARATVLVSWWLLREIEASNAEISHIAIDPENRLAHWRLPHSKTDWVALGATRTHACSCRSSSAIDSICPFHSMVAQLEFAKTRGPYLFPTDAGGQPVKAGWVATFEWVALHLNEPLTTATGASRFTGHTGRATGAVHLAQTQIELWRIQLFGRWGSEAFKLYVRQAPLSQLHLLAQEASVHTALASAKAELAAIFAQIKSSQDLLAKQAIAQQPMQCLVDCEAATGSTPVHSPPETELYVVNRRHLGKVHRVATHGPRVQHYLWHTTCHWYFARHQADYRLVTTIPENAQKCAKCFRAIHQSSSSSDSATSESSSANASG